MTFLLVVFFLGITLTNSLFLFNAENLPDQNDYREESKSFLKTSAQSVSPTLLGKFGDSYNRSTGVYVSGNIAYVADGGDGLEIIDVSDPTNPALLGRFGDDYNYSRDVYVSGNIAYVADGEDGLEIIDVSDPTNPALLGKFGDYYNFSIGVYVSVIPHM